MLDAVSLAGVVLAGGESRRMGRDKASLAVPGGATTMVEHVLGIVVQRCEPVFVMAAPGQPLPALQARIMRDEVRGLGPLPATGRALRVAAEAGARLAFVCAVDMPLLSVELIDHLVRRARETAAEVVLPWDGQDHYLSAVYRTDLADRADALVAAGERTMRALVDASDTQRIVMSDSRPLTNVNTAADLRALTQFGF
ncbi:molybdenum cofactor guanylyltransferase [Mycobacterium haemophilum]|uniref:Probable molybdenum cofactor guanylyltransferase n=1 Tax=Mycobacterium haemophilum TaxID=29311 RepID=A0A0I9U9L0_9MYCO|nr:molybdopterin-guanine dinucleotide biosynthesis protein A [Mycobacterium haemophilum DSM 44634]KLO28430.1 molybdopterin-guanine dinucleotide biosynthesis protein A [Mycobacterium haemophilum]KLO37505.1 molybdopterin-guanine dinucleotide biosynthesis protein A [Mycobacterium haemophilum]KLO44052.1 molybdopterin-guanine dinucleotide biosynthesis protein A [Mycobacterium haemophilum]KLO49320.1 molybdopterin-guanine dinucleotide biosynthesis protein A [Mycobacterium haemophilum]